MSIVNNHCMKQLLQLWAGVFVSGALAASYMVAFFGYSLQIASITYGLLYAGFLVGSLTTKLMK